MPTVYFSNKNNLEIHGLENGFVRSTNGLLSGIDKIDTSNLTSTLQNRLNAIESNISILDNISLGISDISGLSSQLTDINNHIITETSNITSLQGQITTHASDITALQGQITTHLTTHASDITDLQSQIDALPQQSGSSGITLDDTINTIVPMSTMTNSNFAKEWITCDNSGTANIIDMCCSGDGRVSLVCCWSNGSPAISHNYGETWFNPTDLSSSLWSARASLDGKYIIVSDFFNFKISTDYGLSFNFPEIRPYQVYSLDISATGKFMICGCTQNQGLNVSSDYGATWKKRETSVSTWNAVATALDGTIMYGCSDGGVITKSTNQGDTWTTVFTDGSSRAFKSICCSGDGKYVLACYSSGEQLLLSTNYGSSFNLVGTSASYYKVDLSSNGTYMSASVNGSAVHFSINNGETWSSLSNNKFCAIAMSYNAELVYNVSPYNKVMVSKVNSQPLKTVQPTIASTGSTYFDAATNKLYVYNGTAWKSTTLA